MKLVNFRLLVSDFPASLAFWRDLMKLPMTFGDETMGYAYFDMGNAEKSLTSKRKFTSFIEYSFLFSLFFHQVHHKYSTCVLCAVLIPQPSRRFQPCGT